MWQDHVDYVTRKRREVDDYVERQLVELTAYRNRQYLEQSSQVQGSGTDPVAEIDAYEKRHIPPYVRNTIVEIREELHAALPYCFSSKEG